MMIPSITPNNYASGIKRSSTEAMPVAKARAPDVPAEHAPFQQLLALPSEVLAMIFAYVPTGALQTLWCVSNATREQILARPWLLMLWTREREKEIPEDRWCMLDFAAAGTASSSLFSMLSSSFARAGWTDTRVWCDAYIGLAAKYGRIDVVKQLIAIGRGSLEGALRQVSRNKTAAAILPVILADQRADTESITGWLSDIAEDGDDAIEEFASALAHLSHQLSGDLGEYGIGYTLLNCAMSQDSDALVEKILDTWPAKKFVDLEIMMTAIRRCCSCSAVRMLLDRGPDDSGLAREIMQLCCNPEDSDWFEAALGSKYADPAMDCSDILRHAAEIGSSSAVRLLLDDGRVRPDDPECSALQSAASGGFDEVVRMLLDHSNPPSIDAVQSAIVETEHTSTLTILRAYLAELGFCAAPSA